MLQSLLILLLSLVLPARAQHEGHGHEGRKHEGSSSKAKPGAAPAESAPDPTRKIIAVEAEGGEAAKGGCGSVTYSRGEVKEKAGGAAEVEYKDKARHSAADSIDEHKCFRAEVERHPDWSRMTPKKKRLLKKLWLLRKAEAKVRAELGELERKGEKGIEAAKAAGAVKKLESEVGEAAAAAESAPGPKPRY